MRRLRSSSGVTKLRLAILDYNQDGLLSGEELRAWIQKEDDVMNDEEAEEEAKVALEVFDHDKDLSLNKAEFKEAINSREAEQSLESDDHELEEEISAQETEQ
ncbi:unnamed protein product [Durusdinium trenchii]|uniref:EF-hand domain-containing protein n=1 Tax=Durusdinium trenchii TaxID=1381693 RepID=A0ABP0SYU5_9DINO